MSRVTLKLGKVGVSADSSELPQDGQRLITALKYKLFEKCLAIAQKAVGEIGFSCFVNLYTTEYVKYITDVGKIPKRFTVVFAFDTNRITIEMENGDIIERI